ncbi:MAG TPA: pilus assembly protein [Pseudolabrys sp.]|jgi:Flp pilus assembly protein TadG
MFARFLSNTRGGVAPLMAVVAVPMLAAVGMAVDYTRANAARTAFQISLDATALMLSKNAANQDSVALQTHATETFNSLYKQPDVNNISVTSTYNSDAGAKLTLHGSGVFNTNFLGVIGINQINISATSVATWGNTRLRVALVLDNTGSMSSAGKMGALKTASHNLLNQLKESAFKPEDVYVSIVPFSKDVNFGADNYSQSWLGWDLWEAVNGTCSDTRYQKQSSCVSHGKVWTPAPHSTWNGCVTDRDQNFDTTNDAPVAGATLYPTEQYDSCSAPLMGLSNDWTALNAKIDAMQPVGNTNQAIGLQVGWQTLTAAPFTVPPVDPEYKYQTVIILLTDGLNTEDRWYTSQTSIDARQKKTCDNVKAAGITLYTVQVNTGGDQTSSLLKNCASDPGKFFLLTSAGQIVTTFGQIGTSLSKLRLAM